MTDRTLRRLPASLQPLLERSARARAAGRLVEAADAALQLRNAVPDAIPAGLMAAESVLELDRYRLAHDLIAHVAWPPVESAELFLELVRWLRRLEEPQLLERLFDGSPWRAMGPPPLLAEVSLHLGASGLYSRADACVSHALSQAPDEPNLHYLQATFRMFAGDGAGSIEAVERALALRPGMANAHLLLAMQAPDRDTARHAGLIRDALHSTRSAEEVAYLCYALHQRLHALGEHGAAWDALARGHAARRSFTPYSRAEQDALFGALKRLSLPQGAAHEHDGTGLVFIVGMFRSGTSLIERVLAGSDAVVDGGETYQLSACLRQATDHDCPRVLDATIVSRAPSADLAMVRRRMLAYAAWRSGGARWLTEKLPLNFLNIGFILHALPEARIVHMRRDPMDTCFSNLRTFFSGTAPYACDQADMADYFLRYRDLMDHWHARAPGRILDVDYAGFVADPAGQARRLLEYCGLPFEPAVLDLSRSGGTSATASAAHVRKGVLGNRGGAWQAYADRLAPLREALEPAYAARTTHRAPLSDPRGG